MNSSSLNPNLASIKLNSYFSIVFIFAGCYALAAPPITQAETESRSEKIQIIDSRSVPTMEISGVALVPGSAAPRFAVVGDEDSSLYFSNLRPPFESQSISFGNAIWDRYGTCQGDGIPKCAHLKKMITTDWEAIAFDFQKNFLLLQEFSKSVFAFDHSGNKLISKINLNDQSVRQGETISNIMKTQDKSSYEGMVLLRDGHIIVSKEENPRLIIEFGPEGSKPLGSTKSSILGQESFQMTEGVTNLSPLAVWTWPPGNSDCDTSDLSVTQDGQLFALSETCRSISAIQLPIDSAKDHAKGKVEPVPLQIANTWILPDKIKHPEGLAALSDKEWIVTSDRASNKKDNLFHIRSQ